jgi:serine phosphatase RsbU (regulator of sigma subunit)
VLRAERLLMSDILIIDDDSAIREMLARYLRSRGYNAWTASEGRSGIAMCRDAAPHAVLCDLRMPGMDGLAVLAELTRDFPELPVLVVSGTGDLADAIQTLKLGAWDYVTKPIEDLDVLDHAVTKALERARLRAENRAYREHLERVNAQLQRSLHQLEEDETNGREIQFTLLPPSPAMYGGYQCSRYLAPSAFLSGDFADYFAIDADHFGFYMADVSGHGVASAVITVMLKSHVSRYLEHRMRYGVRTILEPAALLAALNRDVVAGRHGKYLTMFYGVVDMKNARMEFANGGQFPFPLLFDGTDATEIGGRSSPVGLFEDARYTGQSLPLPPAFALRLYSDGVLECFPAVDLAGKRELLRELSRNADLDAEALAHRIGLDAPAARPDDATVLSVRRLASGA